MTLPIRIGFLMKLKYGLVFFAGIALLFWPARAIYHRIFHPVETLSMEELVARGDNFYYEKIKDVKYRSNEQSSHKFWHIVPLDYSGKRPLIYLYQGSKNPSIISVSHVDQMDVTNRDIQNMIENIKQQYPNCVIVVANEPIAWWGIILLAVAGTALIMASIAVLRRKYDDSTV